METKTRLHPLLTAAAISLTVFSAVGVATLSGLVPQSIGSQKQEAPLQISEELAKPIEPAIAHPAPAPKKPPAARKTPAARPATPAVYNDYAQVEAPKPVVKPGYLVTIQAVREVKADGQHTALGPIAGGIAG